MWKIVAGKSAVFQFGITLIFLGGLTSHSFGQTPNASYSTEGLAVEVAERKSTTKISRKSTNRNKQRFKQKRVPKRVEIPVDVGIGPAIHQVTGSVSNAQKYHLGVKLSLAAIIDQAVIASQAHRIPKKYRGLAKKVDTVRFRPGPLIFIPDTLFISPPQEDTGIYGANWRFVSIGLPILRMINLGTGLNLTYAYLTGSADNPRTHFVRPGIDLTANLEVPLTQSVLLSLGWSSFVYPPQALGGDVFELGALDQSIWHIGQAYFRLHFRIPYLVSL